MAAPTKAFEANEMGWQGGCYISPALDRRHRIFFAAHYERGALHARKIKNQVERVIFPARPREPLENLGFRTTRLRAF
jgi:hypothetical protein